VTLPMFELQRPSAPVRALGRTRARRGVDIYRHTMSSPEPKNQRAGPPAVQQSAVSPDRGNAELHESDLNGIVALLQLSAGKKQKKNRRDVIHSPSFSSPSKRSRYSPGGTSLSPSSRLGPPGMVATAMSPTQAGLQVPGMMYPVHLHDIPDWMKRAQARMDRVTGPTRVVSKRAGQRAARREAAKQAEKQAEKQEALFEKSLLQEKVDVVSTSSGQPLNNSGQPLNNSDGQMLGKGGCVDRYGSLMGFAGREFVYSDVDAGWYREGRVWMDEILQEVGFDTTGDVMLTRAEWAALRSAMACNRGDGKSTIRRLSRKFMHDSRIQLHMYREASSYRFSVGQAVTAVHPESQVRASRAFMGAVLYGSGFLLLLGATRALCIVCVCPLSS
jgi:hypothetical protein